MLPGRLVPDHGSHECRIFIDVRGEILVGTVVLGADNLCSWRHVVLHLKLARSLVCLGISWLLVHIQAVIGLISNIIVLLFSCGVSLDSRWDLDLQSLNLIYQVLVIDQELIQESALAICDEFLESKLHWEVLNLVFLTIFNSQHGKKLTFDGVCFFHSLPSSRLHLVRFRLVFLLLIR